MALLLPSPALRAATRLLPGRGGKAGSSFEQASWLRIAAIRTALPQSGSSVTGPNAVPLRVCRDPAVPELDPVKERVQLLGELPSPLYPPSGCVFHTRCPIAVERCAQEVPRLRSVGEGQDVACHLV